MERLTLTVEEAAAALGIGRTMAYYAVKSGQIPSVRIGKRRLIPKDGLKQMLNNSGTQCAVTGGEIKP